MRGPATFAVAGLAFLVGCGGEDSGPASERPEPPPAQSAQGDPSAQPKRAKPRKAATKADSRGGENRSQRQGVEGDRKSRRDGPREGVNSGSKKIQRVVTEIVSGRSSKGKSSPDPERIVKEIVSGSGDRGDPPTAGAQQGSQGDDGGSGAPQVIQEIIGGKR